MLPSAPKGLRLHIGLFGRRNVGKSSLLNALVRQQVSIVSPVPGTTTDPVEKPIELLPLGPVLFIDTAGVDDTGSLGAMRIGKTRQAIRRTELAILVAEAGTWGPVEESLLAELGGQKVPVIVVFNKSDVVHGPRPGPPQCSNGTEAGLSPAADARLSPLPAPLVPVLERLAAARIPVVCTAAATGLGIDALRQELQARAPADFTAGPPILSDLVGPGEMAVLVVPIDKEAPKGRLILPQVQAIRDLLDASAFCLVVKDSELPAALARLRQPPKLVVTDSQAFQEVSARVPREIPLTGFSILMSRFKGDLLSQVQGALAIDQLRPNDRVLVAETCSHHPIGDDIGRVKIPRWLRQRVGQALRFDTVQGRDFPQDLSPYSLVVHCGGCMWNRQEMLSRIRQCQGAGVPITNYGLAIAHCLGILDRALEPFPDVLQAYRRQLASPSPAPAPPRSRPRSVAPAMESLV